MNRLHQGYTALKQGVAILDLSPSTRLEHKGPDALDLLNRLTTNDLSNLTPGRAAATVLTSEIGRVIDLFMVVCLQPNRLLLISDSQNPDPLVENIRKYTIVEDAVLNDVSDSTARLAIRGPEAPRTIHALTAIDPLKVTPGEIVSLPQLPEDAFLIQIQGQPAMQTGYEILLPIEHKQSIWNAALAAGAVPASPQDSEAVRIELGVPAPGTELTSRVNPLEAGLERLISFTKGCYVGQEVIARLDTYDKVQRRLVGLTAPDRVKPGDALTADGRDVGWITSAAHVPHTSRTIALGYVRRRYAEPGTTLNANSAQATVVPLPRH